MHLKILSAKGRSLCPGGDELKVLDVDIAPRQSNTYDIEVTGSQLRML